MKVRRIATAKKTVKKQASGKSSVVDRIEPLSVGLNDGVKICIYGKSATGKTTLWATFPKPILAIVCSGSKVAGELLSIKTSEYEKTIKKVVLREGDEITDLIEMQEEAQEFATVVLEHASLSLR